MCLGLDTGGTYSAMTTSTLGLGMIQHTPITTTPFSRLAESVLAI